MVFETLAAGSPAASDDLETLRARLDTIDERLLDALRERIQCCLEIADFKRRNRVPMMQPHRIAAVQERAARYAAEHGIDAEFLHHLYDLIIAETCRVEDLVINDPARA
jgi:chorismate mutase-like protein